MILVCLGKISVIRQRMGFFDSAAGTPRHSEQAPARAVGKGKGSR